MAAMSQGWGPREPGFAGLLAADRGLEHMGRGTLLSTGVPENPGGPPTSFYKKTSERSRNLGFCHPPCL